MSIISHCSKFLTPLSIQALLFTVVFAVAGTLVLGAEPQKMKSYTIDPATVRPGQQYEVLLLSNSTDCETTKELSAAKLVAPMGSAIVSVDTIEKAPCHLTGRIRVQSDITTGSATLWVKTDQALLGTVGLKITAAVGPGPIPPGIPPAVDMFWKVIPDNIVGDNFGGKIKKDYYAIEVTIGNNSGYDLQIVGVGFDLPSERQLVNILAKKHLNRFLSGGQTEDEAIKNIRAKIQQLDSALLSEADSASTKKIRLPNISYRMTRGSQEARHLLYPRTLVLGTITALGPILTGFTPFFHNVNHRANFSEGINIISNPLEKGLELVWPDPRERQRERLDDQVLRDGLVIRNNTQIITLVFFPKELIRLPRELENDREYRDWRTNPLAVRERLGELILIGDEVRHINRVTIIANPPGPVAPPPNVGSPSPPTVKQGSRGKIAFQGSNLEGARLTATGTSGIKFLNEQVDANGRVLTADVEVDKTVRPATYIVIVTTPASNGRDETWLEVEPTELVLKDLVFASAQPKESDTEQLIDITINGEYLHSARLEAIADAKGNLMVDSQSLDESGTKLTAKIRVPAKAKAGDYDLQVVDQRTNVKKKVTFKILKP